MDIPGLLILCAGACFFVDAGLRKSWKSAAFCALCFALY